MPVAESRVVWNRGLFVVIEKLRLQHPAIAPCALAPRIYAQSGGGSEHVVEVVGDKSLTLPEPERSALSSVCQCISTTLSRRVILLQAVLAAVIVGCYHCCYELQKDVEML
jgi:hypothetical protein